jgi:hypothetical protein
MIAAIVAVGIVVSRDSHPHVGSPLAVRLAAAAIVTAFAAVAKFVAGPRAAAVTGVIWGLDRCRAAHPAGIAVWIFPIAGRRR